MGNTFCQPEAHPEARLLILGAGSAGKSTIYKQLNHLYGKEMTQQELETYRPDVYYNLLDSAQQLILGHNNLKQEVRLPDLLEGNVEHARAIEALDARYDEVTPDVGARIASLWRDPAMKETLAHRHKFVLMDTASHFLDSAERIGDEMYKVTWEDCLACRHPTTGIIEKNFDIDDLLVTIVDVGGQRSERRKWVHCFEDVTAVIFVAALSGYDSHLYEDRDTCRMQEALTLFNKIGKARWFVGKPVILFLNKQDVFDEMIRRRPLTTWRKDYPGQNPDDPAETKEFIRNLFLSQIPGQDREVHVHLTCATKPDSVRTVFSGVSKVLKEAVIRQLQNPTPSDDPSQGRATTAEQNQF